MVRDICSNKPLTMHIDLNSCFATVMQQADVHLRKKPLVIAAYTTENGCILSPSIEAKQCGIKTGMTVRQARLLNPSIIVRVSDTVMVRDVHEKFMRIFSDYSPVVIPKSIDEAILEFGDGASMGNPDLIAIAKEIKSRMRTEIGEWIRCSIGIGTNRFLAKTAASFHKPDGLTVIDHANLKKVYAQLQLTDLNGINVGYAARLNMHGIFTPLQFLDAPVAKLKNNVFQSIVGFYWYMRLRGHEVDAISHPQRSYGQDYALQKPTDRYEIVAPLFIKLCEKMGRRLRAAGQAAHGVHVGCVYQDGTYWHVGKKGKTSLYTTIELYRRSMQLLRQQTRHLVIRKIMVSCYDLVPLQTAQPMLFDLGDDKNRLITKTMDAINDRFGEFTIVPALMMGMEHIILDRIAFGSIKENKT